MIYRMDAGTGTLAAADLACAVAGSGPRRLAFLWSTNWTPPWSPLPGIPRQARCARSRRSTLPPGFSGESTAVDVEVHPAIRSL
jgi:hypothetical protein